MANREQKLVLAFPPTTAPCSAPLGIAMLKGYIERTMGQWAVRTVDFNARLFRHIQTMVAGGKLHDPHTLQQGLLSEIALARAFEVFHGNHPDEFFQRADRYTIYAQLFRSLVIGQINATGGLKDIFGKGPPFPAIINQMIDVFLADDPDAVGISVNYDAQIWSALCLASGIKARRKIPVVFGGTAFCVNPRRLMAAHHDIVDFVIAGEGELPLAGLLASGFHPANVPGITWWDGQVRSNDVVVEKEIDRLGAPDFSDFDLGDYFSPLPVLPVLTSRGCYWRRCAFCVHYRSAGLTYRFRSVPAIIEELKRHVDRGVRHFAFVDEMISPAHFRRLADAIIEAGLHIAYYAMAKPTHHFKESLLARMRHSGCRFLLWGVESGSQRILDLMEKGTRIEDVAVVLRNSAQAGIVNHVFMLFGFPSETAEEFNQTLQFLHTNQAAIWAVHGSIFGLEEGSPVLDDPGRFGISAIVGSGDWRSGARYEYQCASGMSKAQVHAAYQQNLPFISSFNPFSGGLANHREHAILIYDRLASRLAKNGRQIPPFQPL